MTIPIARPSFNHANLAAVFAIKATAPPLLIDAYPELKYVAERQSGLTNPQSSRTITRYSNTAIGELTA